MLLVVVVLVYGTLHLFGTEINRDEWQLVVGSFSWRAPDGVALFQCPVAEGYDDMLKLQSLAFMDGYESDAVNGTCLNCLRRDAVVPLLNERVDVDSVVCKEIGQSVVECVDVGILPLNTVYIEYVV